MIFLPLGRKQISHMMNQVFFDPWRLNQGQESFSISFKLRFEYPKSGELKPTIPVYCR